MWASESVMNACGTHLRSAWNTCIPEYYECRVHCAALHLMHHACAFCVWFKLGYQ